MKKNQGAVMEEQEISLQNRVVEDYRTPVQGYVPSFGTQFPGLSQSDAIGALRIMVRQLGESIRAVEEKYDILFPEFHYEKRLHHVNEREVAELIRHQLVSSETGAECSEDPTLTMLQCTGVWGLMSIEDNAQRLDIPMNLIEEVPGEEGLQSLPFHLPRIQFTEDLEGVIAGGKRRYTESSDALLKDKEFMRSAFLLSFEIERVESLAKEISCFYLP